MTGDEVTEPWGVIDAAIARAVIGDGNGHEGPPLRLARRTFARQVLPALVGHKCKKWILLGVDGRWVRYTGPMTEGPLLSAARSAGLVGDFGIYGDAIIPMWAVMEEMAAARKQRRKRSPESIERTRAKAKAAWARKKAAT